MCMYFLLDIVWVSSLITFHRLERERGGERGRGEKGRGGRERERRERKTDRERGDNVCVSGI